MEGDEEIGTHGGETGAFPDGTMEIGFEQGGAFHTLEDIWEGCEQIEQGFILGTGCRNTEQAGKGEQCLGVGKMELSQFALIQIPVFWILYAMLCI